MTDKSNLPARQCQQPGRDSAPPELVVLVTDVGAPVALHEFLLELPPSFNLPIVVLQPTENVLLEANLNAMERTVPFAISLLKDGDLLAAGNVYVGLTDFVYMLTCKQGKFCVSLLDMAESDWPMRESLTYLSSELGEHLTVIFLTNRLESSRVEQLTADLKESGATIARVASDQPTATTGITGQLFKDFDSITELAQSLVAQTAVRGNNQLAQAFRQ